jgi:hypothetical protein
MQFSMRTKRDGSLSLQLDVEAAHVIFASVLFASRFHEGIAPLATIAEEGLRNDVPPTVRRTDLCQ